MTKVEQMINRLAKWRTVFAGWQLGTRAKGDPESDAVRDHRELSMLLRVEVTAITRLLLEKGVYTKAELDDAVYQEAYHLNEAYEKKFPGIQATDSGLTITAEAAQTMWGWKP